VFGFERMDDLDRAVIAGVRRGDEQAFRRLLARHQQPVYALCVALAGPDGEDLAQETFLRVFRAAGEFDPRGPATLRSWILCIARRLCQDRARHVRRGVEVAIPPPDASDPAEGPEDRLASARLGERLRAAVGALPEEQRVVIALREWEGLEYEEIAAVEGVPVGTIRSRLARARAALRDALGDDAEVDGREKGTTRTRVAPV
jgi:RNA polymerase sigma-70 factor, ECF subfamily